MQPVILKFQQNARKNARTFLPVNNWNLQMNNFVFRYVPDYLISKKISGELTLTDRQKNFLPELGSWIRSAVIEINENILSIIKFLRFNS
jgi:hypothetical protein